MVTTADAQDVYDVLYDGLSLYAIRLYDRDENGVVRNYPPNGLVDWAVRKIIADMLESGVDFHGTETILFDPAGGNGGYT